MASQYHRLLDPRVLYSNDVQDLREAFDAGAFKTLEIDIRILKSGSGGNLKLQHAAVNEPGAYRDLNGTSVAVTGTGNYVSVANFLRYIRWICDGAVAGDPVGLIDIVAKD